MSSFLTSARADHLFLCKLTNSPTSQMRLFWSRSTTKEHFPLHCPSLNIRKGSPVYKALAKPVLRRARCTHPYSQPTYHPAIQAFSMFSIHLYQPKAFYKAQSKAPLYKNQIQLKPAYGKQPCSRMSTIVSAKTKTFVSHKLMCFMCVQKQHLPYSPFSLLAPTMPLPNYVSQPTHH